MATEANFQNNFIRPLMECYGQIKFPAIRVKKIWERLKLLPDNLMGPCAEKIILNFDMFPGIQKILDTCAEVANEYSYSEVARIKATTSCYKCASQGVIVANNYAYKCTCQLGELLYPSYPLHQGQVHVQDKVYTDNEGNRVFENGSHLTIVPRGCKNIKQIKTIVKDPITVLKKKDNPSFRKPMFNDFTPEPA